MQNLDDIRRMALALPEAYEADHHGVPSFRVGKKIFCTLRLDEPKMMLKLDPEDQRNVVEDSPEAIWPVPGYWGQKGSTFLRYDRLDPERTRGLMRLAWASVAPKRLVGTGGGA